MEKLESFFIPPPINDSVHRCCQSRGVLTFFLNQLGHEAGSGMCHMEQSYILIDMYKETHMCMSPQIRFTQMMMMTFACDIVSTACAKGIRPWKK